MSEQQQDLPVAPVAMFRGIFPCWALYDGSPGVELARFTGTHDVAMRSAREWCEEHGWYLSSWSDADDRVANSECICGPAHGDVFLPGCPMHRPALPSLTTEREDGAA